MVRVQLPQVTKRESSFVLLKTLVANNSAFHVGQSRPAYKSTTVDAAMFPRKVRGSTRLGGNSAGPASLIIVRNVDGADPWYAIPPCTCAFTSPHAAQV